MVERVVLSIQAWLSKVIEAIFITPRQLSETVPLRTSLSKQYYRNDSVVFRVSSRSTRNWIINGGRTCACWRSTTFGWLWTRNTNWTQTSKAFIAVMRIFMNTREVLTNVNVLGDLQVRFPKERLKLSRESTSRPEWGNMISDYQFIQDLHVILFAANPWDWSVYDPWRLEACLSDSRAFSSWPSNRKIDLGLLVQLMANSKIFRIRSCHCSMLNPVIR